MDGRLNVVLFEPEIPQNTGNIMRTCVAASFALHLIKPLGFDIDNPKFRRSTTNHITWADYKIYENYEDFKVELKDRYIESANKFSFVEKRLVNAFPDLKFTNVDDELKEWINERIDKKIEKRNNER